MLRVTVYLDFLSPEARAAFERLPLALEGCSYATDYRPVSSLTATGPDDAAGQALLRLALACSQDGAVSRFVAATLFDLAGQGEDAPADDPARRAGRAPRLSPRLDPAGPEVGALLRANTAAARAAGVAVMPAIVVDGILRTGPDALSRWPEPLRETLGTPPFPGS